MSGPIGEGLREILLRDLEQLSRTEDHLDAAPQDLWIQQMQERGERDEDRMSNSVCPKCGIVGCECVKVPTGVSVRTSCYNTLVFDEATESVKTKVTRDNPYGLEKLKSAEECAEREGWLAKARKLTAKPEEIREILKGIFDSFDADGKLRRGKSVSIWERVLAAALVTEAWGDVDVLESHEPEPKKEEMLAFCAGCIMPAYMSGGKHTCGR